jgi:hypothetical protein
MDVATFPLIWRWTQESHAVLPADVLKALRVVSSVQIELLRDFASSRLGAHKVQHRATLNAAETNRWLADLHPLGGRVIVVWNSKTALSLPWESFVTYWSDFCYPSSDDVDIFGEGGSRFLRWRHDATFEYDGDPL